MGKRIKPESKLGKLILIEALGMIKPVEEKEHENPSRNM